MISDSIASIRPVRVCVRVRACARYISSHRLFVSFRLFPFTSSPPDPLHLFEKAQRENRKGSFVRTEEQSSPTIGAMKLTRTRYTRDQIIVKISFIIFRCVLASL